MKSNIKVIIADDHKLFRRGMIAVLNDIEGIDLIDEAENGVALLEKLKDNVPDIILMDIKMPEMDGIEATKQVLSDYPEVKIIMLTMHDDEEFIKHLVDIGVHGYLLKNTDVKEVTETITNVMDKGLYFNKWMTDMLIEGFLNRKEETKVKEEKKIDFTDKELTVLQLICDGNTNAEIGVEMKLSPRTAEGYRYKLCEKVGVHNTASLVKYAVKNSIIE